MNIRIETILFRDIAEYIRHPRWKEASRVPITPERALSQEANPHAREDDPCLWVALGKEDQVVAFAGSLPGYDMNRDRPVGWNTCWWADPVLGKEAAMPLLLTFLQHWDMKVAFSDMTSHTAAIIRQLDFCHVRKEALLQVILRLPGRKLAERLGLAGIVLSPVAMFLAAVVNQVLQIRIRAGSRGVVELERLPRINDEMYKYIREKAGGDFQLRSREEWTWIEERSWLAPPGKESRRMARRYPFSSLARSFREEWLVLREEGELKSVLRISLRQGFLKVLYYYGDAPDLALEGLVRLLRIDRSVYSVVLAHPVLLAHAEKLKSMGIRAREHSRWTAVSKKLMDEYPADMHMQLGDGDVVFT